MFKQYFTICEMRKRHFSKQYMCYKYEQSLFLLYDRIQSMNEEENSCSKDSQRTRSETITDNYTELGLENVSAEPENQYESLARQENYTNLNMV